MLSKLEHQRHGTPEDRVNDSGHRDSDKFRQLPIAIDEARAKLSSY